MTHKDRYNAVHKVYQCAKTPTVCADGHYSAPKMPDTKKSNGLTNYVVNAINWQGGNATRISSAGRMIDTLETQRVSGTVLKVKKYIPSTTRKGSADCSSTILGKSAKFEIKIGSDKASQWQLDEQVREIKAGGYYFFIKTPDEFWECYDKVVKGER